MDDRKKERFGRYEILSELGRGAMGIVYKARDPKINRDVAVKTISLAGQPPEEEREYRERFLREAEAAGRLSHPGIVTIFDMGEEPETRSPYIVMEFVAGQSLDKVLLARGDHRLPAETALQIALELAEALDCAHGQGVVHRDLKPANVLVAEDGHVKIADFGVAKLNLANATLAGRSLGTPAFMSPEQLNGGPVDGRSDLFSLGVLLYTILTGYRPFQGNSALTVAFKVVNRDPIPATVLDTDLPPGLDYIIARAIAKNPPERYQRGMEMALDIQELQQGREPWSKAKKPLSGSLAEKTNENGRSSALLGSSSNYPSSRRIVTPQRGVAEKLLLAMRSTPVAAVFFALGIVLFGVRMNRMTDRPEAQSRTFVADASAATTLPRAAEAPPSLMTGALPLPATATPRNVTPSLPARPLAPRPALVKVARSSATPAAASAAPGAMLDIEIEHKFAEAQLSIWVDDRLAYEHSLAGSDKTRLAVFHRVEGHEFHAMQITSGKHSLRVRVTTGADTPGQSGTIAGDFPSGTEKSLRIQFAKHGEMNLSLQ
jgi:serine/threonine-protein kinase